MDYFEQDKADKLKRLIGLRIANALGMVAWRANGYGGASQKLRMLHPLSWFWVAVVLFAIVAHGVIEVWKERKTLWRDQCVWW
jgi:hypothetical protein